MTIFRDLNVQVDEIKAMLTRVVATRTMRDPLGGAHPDLTGPQIHVLVALMAAGPDAALPSMSLAQRIGSSGPTMTGLIDRLERQGMVTRERDDEDRRLVLVRLTEAGRTACALLDAHFTERFGKILSVLEPDDRETFVRLLKHICAALDEKNTP